MRPLKNVAEEGFRRMAVENGWTLSKRGWPDFICFGPAGQIMAVEVKPRFRSGDTSKMKILKREQAAAMDALSAAGIECYVSDGVTLERYSRALHAPENRRRNKQAVTA